MAFVLITDNGRDPAPAGSQMAVITALVDVGTQRRKKWVTVHPGGTNLGQGWLARWATRASCK